ncbi:MAG: PilZ domain-containing protein [Deltaproteobacteria bacterium]|jgi:hypothetical protein
MTISPDLAERRNHPRFSLKPGAYVVNAARPGLITDISLGGLSWRYVDRKKWPESSPTLDILIEGYGTSIVELPYQIVSDCEVEHDCPDRSLAVRRRSIQFGELSAGQRLQLEELIRQNAVTRLQLMAFPN